MPPEKGNGNPWGSRAGPPDLDDLIQQGRDRLKQLMPSGGPRGVIVIAVLVMAGLGILTAY